jgi:hypothetical protein
MHAAVVWAGVDSESEAEAIEEWINDDKHGWGLEDKSAARIEIKLLEAEEYMERPTDWLF